MSTDQEALEDFDAAFDRLRQAIRRDSVEERRALREALACLYELREYRCGDARSTRDAYYQRAAAVVDGEITEGLIFVRGKATHHLLHDVAPQVRGLFPGPTTFPGQHTYPGSNLVWRAFTELSDPPPLRTHDKLAAEAYERRVAGQPVLETLQAAQKFLAADLGPLADHS